MSFSLALAKVSQSICIAKLGAGGLGKKGLGAAVKSRRLEEGGQAAGNASVAGGWGEGIVAPPSPSL